MKGRQKSYQIHCRLNFYKMDFFAELNELRWFFFIMGSGRAQYGWYRLFKLKYRLCTKASLVLWIIRFKSSQRSYQVLKIAYGAWICLDAQTLICPKKFGPFFPLLLKCFEFFNEFLYMLNVCHKCQNRSWLSSHMNNH